MRKKFVQIVAVILIFTMMSGTHAIAGPLLGGTNSFDNNIPDWLNPEPSFPSQTIVPTVPSIDVPGNLFDPSQNIPGAVSQKTISVGLYFGTDTLPAANLQNYTGAGFRFGILNNGTYTQIGFTDRTKISVLKTQNLFYSDNLPDGGYGYSDQISSDIVVGCFHLELNQSFNSYEEAYAVSQSVGGFPAWINGAFVVRIGAFSSKEEAERAAFGRPDVLIKGTSSYGMTIVETGSSLPLFQFDGSAGCSQMVVKPGLDDNIKSVTWFKGYRYFGSFRYERDESGNLAVVNLVDIEDYVNCVISREMNDSWPLEALKAQAVAVRTYALTCTGHSTFDICYNEHCQAYYGMGSTGENTTRATAETAGMYARYNGELIRAFYYSSNGGATENCENVWTSSFPYLQGVIDPYEALVESEIKNYHWTVTYTGQQLAERLNKVNSEYNCAEVVDVRVTQFTPTGNVYSVMIVDRTGKTIEIKKDKIRTHLALKSLRFTLGDQGDGYSLAGGGSLQALNFAWVLNGDGTREQIRSNSAYAITENGIQEIVPSQSVNNNGVFTFTGTGNGHNLGMSQWGAKAMANQGYTFDQILNFYYTGIEIY